MAKKVTWLELFYDLVFVAAIAKATHVLVHEKNGVIPSEYLFKFLLIFVPIWWAWVGQSLFMNRFGEDTAKHRIFMVTQMFFVLVMTASLDVDFDKYYLIFLIGYVGIRFLTSFQYLWVSKREHGARKDTALFLGYGFLIGIGISLCSLFFDTWIKYLVLYIGIFIDILLPLLGRKYLKKVSTHLPHLFERFGLFTIILFGESIVSVIVILKLDNLNWQIVSFAVVSFALVVAMWWQYYDHLEKKVNKNLASSGQSIIYGHLFLSLSLSVIGAIVQLTILYEINYLFLLFMIYAAILLYVVSVTFAFHKYQVQRHPLYIRHFCLLIGLLLLFLIFDLVVTVPIIIVFIQIGIFFMLFRKATS
ncbi:low temperature requirement protein A [Shimazuella kribbensis]|uniref:low temperature requirement protein A n=1 Tax=Shimazuella kribbensis TaxID=139808 RepID=UPI0004085E59|nr:low temperature requirement protein A [Shimazuella kribbensis]